MGHRIIHIVSWSKLTWFCQVTRDLCQIPLLLIKLLFRYCIKLSWSNLSYCIMVHGVIYMNWSSSLRHMSNSTLCWSNYCLEWDRYLYQTLLIKLSHCCRRCKKQLAKKTQRVSWLCVREARDSSCTKVEYHLMMTTLKQF